MKIYSKKNSGALLVASALVLTLIVVCVSATAFMDTSEGADEAIPPFTDEQGVIYTIYPDDDFATVTGYVPNITTANIPSKITVGAMGEYDVLVIGERAFGNCTTLESVTVETGSKLTTIEAGAFASCISLGSFTFGADSQLTSIGASAFVSCRSLTSFTIPETVTLIDKYAFNDSALTSIVIPDSVITIEEWAFSASPNLGTVTFGADSSLTTIGHWAFEDCAAISISIPDNVSKIGHYAFNRCNSLESVTFGKDSKLTTIDYYAFNSCASLTTIDLPSGITKIVEGLFSGCAALTEFVIPDNITIIEDVAFSGTGLSYIAIPGTVESIGTFAFRDCSRLTEISLYNITALKNAAFNNCTSLTSVTILGHGQGPIGANLLNAYFSTTPWKMEGSADIETLTIDTTDTIDIDNVSIIDGNVLILTAKSTNVIGAEDKLIFEGAPVTGADRAEKKYTASDSIWEGEFFSSDGGSSDSPSDNTMLIVIAVIIILVIIAAIVVWMMKKKRSV